MLSKFGKVGSLGNSISLIISFFTLFLITGRVSAEHNLTCHLPEGPLVLYEDRISQGWNTEWSWGGNTTPWITQSTPGGQGGSHALKAVVAAPTGGGLEFHTDYGKSVSTGGRTALAFSFRKEMSANVRVGIRDSNNVVPTEVPLLSNGTALGNGTWYSFVIPLSDLQSADKVLGGVMFITDAPGTMYVDNVMLREAPGLAFPISGKTPYNSVVTAILDKSIDVTQGNHGYFHRNNVVSAYNGETGSSVRVCYNQSCTIAGYKKDATGTPFNLSLLNYNDLDSGDSPQSPRNILWYDGHSGYDYGEPRRTNILAAHSGTLCVATDRTSSDGVNVWRNASKCPHGRDPINWNSSDSWNKYHVFYILYPNTEYSTWYLHADDLSESVRNAVIQNGYVDVAKGNHIAFVGDWGVPGAVHLHFEARKNAITEVDPYGNGASGHILMLWDMKP
jgi:hypothetical protein